MMCIKTDEKKQKSVRLKMKRQRPDNDDSGDGNYRYAPWSSLSNDLLTLVFTYCDTLDWLALRRTNQAFRQASYLVVSRASSLTLSYLVRLHRGTKRYKYAKRYQEQLVSAILSNVQSCKRLELCGLRHVTGAPWLNQVLSNGSQLVSLDLRGCWQLDPRLFQNVIESSLPQNLLHLNLQGCRRIDADTVLCIATKLVQLHSLLLGGCSQTINNDCLRSVCTKLRQLRALDMSGLKRITDVGATYLMLLPPSLTVLTLSGCEKVRLSFLHLLGLLLSDRIEQLGIHACALATSAGKIEDVFCFIHDHGRLGLDDFFSRNDAFRGWKNLRVLHADVGTHRDGMPPYTLGLLACFSFGALREVDVTGCARVCDKDVEILAATCANSLTSLDLKACVSIGDKALEALATHECNKLAYLDISSCFEVTGDGVMQLCPTNGIFRHSSPGASVELVRDRNGCPALRSLKLAYLTDMTDDALLAIAGMIADQNEEYLGSDNSGLNKLLLLDVRGCPGITSRALGMVVSKCPSLIEVNARDTDAIQHRAALTSHVNAAHSLRIVNGRRLTSPSTTSCSSSCIASRHSQRIENNQGVPLQLMLHCIDCGLVPSCNRGICRSCCEVCHQGHNTYVGSFAQFSCDCAYAISGRECRALPLS